MTIYQTLRNGLLSLGILLSSCSIGEKAPEIDFKSLRATERLEQKIESEPLVVEIPEISINAPPAKDSLEKKLEGIEIVDIFYVAGKEGDKTASQKPVYAQEGENVWLYAVVKAKTPEGTVYFTEADQIKLKGKKIPSRKIQKWDFSEKLPILWHKVEADIEGKSYDRNDEVGCSDDMNSCKEVDYQDTFWRSGWKVKADVHPSLIEDQFPGIESGLGVMRYRASTKYGEEEFSTRKSEEIKNWRDAKKIPRVSFREDEGHWTDYIFELFNTPYIWGSTTAIADNQIGSDCADLLVYARRRAGHKQKYTWSEGLRSRSKLIADVTGFEGQHFIDQNGEKIPLEKIEKGDIIYSGRHVAIFYQDNGDGFLGQGDKMIETLFHEPEITAIDSYPFEIRRWKK